MTPSLAATSAPQWVQVLLSVLGVLGGTSGVAAIATVVAQRGKFKAEAADMLTDAALTLVQPMRLRVSELEAEAQAAREQLRISREQTQRATATLTELHATLDRWYALIFAAGATLQGVRSAVREDRRRRGEQGEQRRGSGRGRP
ncbi:hypothetical protein [Micromonospora sp. ATA51]|uniref:hypothetical protein n=1 Tax=Micromonospora sp. ATA51 TaxID=2806098 RepID=UPI001EE473DC|nr:hypothetical protein [Micromonospora sp. ATA51]